MAVPGHDQRDFDFAKAYDLEIRRVLVEKPGDDLNRPLEQAFTDYGPMVNSARPEFDGLSGDDAKSAVIDALESENTGLGTTQYRLRDWLLSRQRFWGTPIPMIHCDSCGIVRAPKGPSRGTALGCDFHRRSEWQPALKPRRIHQRDLSFLRQPSVA